MKEKVIAEDSIRASLLEPIHDEPEELDEWHKKSCCGKCCHYLFCCCCCINYEKSKSSYRKGWRKYLTKEGNDSSNEPFVILTNLFANADNAIEALESIRLNPNLVSENKLRNDLEFYIPQLCTFLLFGEVKAIEEFFVFLCKVCNASFFFAHRVHWFLSAMINNAQEKKDDIISILKMINTLFKSESKNKKNKLEKFYLANSDRYMKYIKSKKLFFLYDNKYIQEGGNIFNKIDFNSLNAVQQRMFNKYKESRDIIEDFCDHEYQKANEKEIAKLKEKGKNITGNNINNTNINYKNNNSKSSKFNPNDFFIDISNFPLNNKDITYEEDDIVDEGEYYSLQERNIDFLNVGNPESDINFISYHSSLNFIDHLCDISNDLPKYPIEEQQLFLYEQLNLINKKLPCNVYLPFLKDSARNYLVVHIPLDGVKIFRTKTRCPIMLTFELVRIDEINKEIEEEEERNEEIGFTRSKSISSGETSLTLDDDDDDEIIPGKKKKKRKKKKKKELLIDKITASDSKYYNKIDYDLSKPVRLNRDNSNKKNKKETVSKRTKAHELNYILGGTTDGSHNKDANTSCFLNTKENETEKDKFQKILNKFKKKKSGALARNEENSKTIFQNPIQMTMPNQMPDFDDIDTSSNVSVSKNFASKFTQKKKEEIIVDTRNSINNINELIEQDESPSKENTFINTACKSLNVNEIYHIFGETFAQKSESIKKTSLFGKFKSHKLFRCIFKTHEDLRQEQFATQLINEFNQIFKIEKVNCWLNTYEIISTGNDAGLVEMVNDSLSLDQLKQKLGNISLRDFYIHHWGKGNVQSQRYKNAMNNFVSSLAGYSLACYFLQIKDRHNGNILIDNEGHLTHIDFGFLLSNAPGKGLKFENAPFKLSQDMVDCLGGVNGDYFDNFRKLLKKGFLAVYKHRQKIIILVEMMWCGHGRNLDCFEKGQEAIDELKLRLAPKDCRKKTDMLKFVDSLIEQSVDNWRTKWYDIFQYYVQGIFY